jgi:tripartite-type tricarboxylate transporter receptor subunit TctC
MDTHRRRALHAGAAALAGVAAPALRSAHAADGFPSKPIRIIAPAAPGGILDQTSRLMSKGLTDGGRFTALVENVPGAGGTLGIMAMLRAEPDGHTLVMGSLGPNAANYTLQDKLPYTADDLAPVVHVLSMPNVLVASPALGVKSVEELRARARAGGKGLTMAVSTSGSSGHLAGELFKIRSGIPAVNVIYRGAAPALNDLVGGQVDFMVDNLITALPLVRGGRLVALAVTTRDRIPELPEVPSLAESGFPDIDVAVWLGLFVSAKTPADRVATLNAELQKVLAMPEIRQRMADQGGKAIGGSPQAFGRFAAGETERWAQVIRTANIRPD